MTLDSTTLSVRSEARNKSKSDNVNVSGISNPGGFGRLISGYPFKNTSRGNPSW